MSELQAASATQSGAPDPLIGRVIAGRFKITDLIARGGMGKVYRAEQTPLDRVCALKVLHPNYMGDADPEFQRRFFREASTASKITHPNSVTIFDYGKTDDDIYYMAMEYLEGFTLHQTLRRVRTMSEERVSRIAQQVCRALREAHAQGVIHRDLKPANIFLTRHGDDDDFVKVLDFGLVKHVSERPEEQLTQTGLFMGSPKYMAPEQIQGEMVDARTDIYSLGIILYEMLAGKVPFERATSVNILMAHVGEPPPPMIEVNPNLECSQAFHDLVMRCIAKNPAERFGSMDELLQAIKRVHGVSLTGQLSAVHASGSFPPGSIPPSAVTSNFPPPVLASGVQDRLDPQAETLLANDLVPAPQRSRTWIALGVVIAAVLGGAVGLLAVRMTNAEPPLPAKSAPAVGVGALPAASAASPATTTEPASSNSTTVYLTTDPPGASVREDSVELCPATPCEVVYAKEVGDFSHKLVVTKDGYRPATREIKAGDGSVAIKLTHLGATAGGRVPTPPSPVKRAEPSPAAQPTTAPASTTPSGFKDLPY